jgi:phosphoribosylamine-glycine ligase
MAALQKQYRIMVFGIGAFSQGVLRILKEAGAEVCTYLTRDYGHYGPMQEGKTYHKEYYPNPCDILREEQIDFIVPMSIDWALQDWTEEFLSLNVPILSPTGEAYQIERERDYSQRLCERYGIPFAKSFVARNKFEAEQILRDHPMPYVIKNTFCSPTSPIHTIVSETIEQTQYWLDNIDYKEGVFLQQYAGRKEVGHIVFISNGQVYSLVTNQEYKRAFDGNQGIVAGAPLGGLVEWDPDDKYGISQALIHPLLPWFQATNFHGPLQVTAAWYDHKWQVLEYNVRLGVTSGPLILRMLKDPIQVLEQVVKNQPVSLKLSGEHQFGASLTLAGYGYPYTQLTPPRLPVQILEPFDCDVWWNEVDQDLKGRLATSGYGANRIADLTATGASVEEALESVYRNIHKISCAGSYYRTDVGKSLWPPIYE